MNDSVIPLEAELTLFRSQLARLQRRTSRRYRTSLATPGKLLFTDTGVVLTAWVFNLSLTGVGLQVAQSLKPKQEIVIHLKAMEGAASLDLTAVVAHSTPVADGTWRVGCAFVKKLTADQLETLL